MALAATNGLYDPYPSLSVFDDDGFFLSECLQFQHENSCTASLVPECGSDRNRQHASSCLS